MESQLDTGFNLYDFNKVNMAQIKPYDPIVLNRMCGRIADDLWALEKPTYWMLLCRERNDYTVFRIESDKEELKSALVECVSNRGMVLDISKQEDGAYEIWIRDIDTKDNVVYYLFDYNGGIIEV